MKNLIKDLTIKFQDASIKEIERELFLNFMTSYMERGHTEHETIEMFIEFGNSQTALIEQIKRLKKQLEKGKYKLSDLLFEYKFLKSDYEKSLYEKSNRKDEAIKIIVEHRKKHHNITKIYLYNYLQHIIIALALMHIYIFQDYYIKSFLEVANMTSFSKIIRTKFLAPDYWRPFEMFVLGSFYLAYSLYCSFMVSFGKHISLKYYYKLQQHQELNELILFMQMLKDQNEVGYTLYDSLENIKKNSTEVMKVAINKLQKNIKNGKKRYASVFEDMGFSYQTSKTLKILEHSNNSNKAIEDILYLLLEKREQTAFRLNKEIEEVKAFKKSVLYGIIILISVVYFLASKSVVVGI